MKQQKKKLAYYLTSEKPTSKVRHLAFKFRSLVISYFYYFLKFFYVEKSQRSQKFLSKGFS